MTADLQAVVERILAEPVLDAGDGPFIELWLSDRDALLAALRQPVEGEVQAMVDALRRKWPIENKRRFGLINPDGPAAAAMIERLALQSSNVRDTGRGG